MTNVSRLMIVFAALSGIRSLLERMYIDVFVMFAVIVLAVLLDMLIRGKSVVKEKP